MKAKIIREPIATWWRIVRYKPGFEPLQIVAFTASFVTYLQNSWRLSGPDVLEERRESRDDIFPSFIEAKSEAIRRAFSAVEQAKRYLQEKRTFLGNIESLTESGVTKKGGK